MVAGTGQQDCDLWGAIVVAAGWDDELFVKPSKYSFSYASFLKYERL